VCCPQRSGQQKLLGSGTGGIVMPPRRASSGEHRNDHQIATAKRLAAQGRIDVVFDERELAGKLDQLDVLNRSEHIGAEASQELMLTIRTFIETGHVRPEPSSASA
jgi:hypothetical protein